jgi:hypothetical protein
MLFRALNPKSSLVLSFLSGAGLIAVISLAPTKNEKGNYIMEEPPKQVITRRTSDSSFQRAIEKREQKKEDDTLLNLKLTPQDLKEYTDEIRYYREKLGNYHPGFSKIFSVKNFSAGQTSFRTHLDPTSRSIQWKEEDISVEASYTTSGGRWSILSDSQEMRSTSFNTLPRHSYIRRLEFFELDVPISESLSAVMTTSSRDTFDDRQKDVRGGSLALAGISINKENILSTRLVAGDSNLQLNKQAYTPGYMGATHVQKLRDPGFNERESTGLHTFEWQTNLNPTKGVRVQTAIYNTPSRNTSRSNMSNMPDSGRMSLFLGEKRVILNLKYDYQMPQEDTRLAMSQWSPQKDSASLGLIFFLDPSQYYSVYLGGNQFNIANRTQGSSENRTSARLPASFSASFRGKSKTNQNSNFFLNFQNQPPGAWGLGLSQQSLQQNSGNPGSKSFYEYATSMGMELSF